MNIDDAIRQACTDVAIQPPRRVQPGKWVQTDTLAGKSGKGDGRVKLGHGFVTAWNWQTGERSTVSMKDGLSATEKQALAVDIAKAKAKQEADAVRASGQAAAMIAAATTRTHPYLAGKGFPDEQVLVLAADDVRRLGGRHESSCFKPADYLIAGHSAIIVPARIGDHVASVQLIWEDGTKKFLFGGEVGGAAHRIATGVDQWHCEGLATGLTVRNALRGMGVRATVKVCFSASNVLKVARTATGRAFIATDNDKPLPHFSGLGTGEFYARQAGIPYAMPPKPLSDFNDMYQDDGIFAVQRVLTSVMAGRRAA